MRFIEVSTIYPDRGVHVLLPQDWCERQVIFGMVLQPFDRKDVAHQMGIQASARVAESDLANKIPKRVFSEWCSVAHD